MTFLLLQKRKQQKIVKKGLKEKIKKAKFQISCMTFFLTLFNFFLKSFQVLSDRKKRNSLLGFRVINFKSFNCFFSVQVFNILQKKRKNKLYFFNISLAVIWVGNLSICFYFSLKNMYKIMIINNCKQILNYSFFIIYFQRIF